MRLRRHSTARTALIEVAILLALAVTLLVMGRALACRCGEIALWSGDIWSNQNSQQFADPYSLTHVTHGVLLYGALRLLWRSGPLRTRLIIATIIEAAWEVAENTDFVINRYREATISLDYFGDSVINSVMDIVWMLLGFFLTARLPVWVSVALVVALELFVGYFIRDNLTLNIIMLLHPVDAIRTWQNGG